MRYLILFLLVLFTLTAQAQDIPQVVTTPDVMATLQYKIYVDGLPTVGTYHKESGAIQVVTCAEPHRWISSDRRDTGWACYETFTQLWVMNAQLTAPVISAPVTVTSGGSVVIAQPYTQVVYSPYPPQYIPYPDYRPYGYGGYGYPQPVAYPPVVVRSSRVVIARDAIRESGRVVTAAVGGRRR